MNWEIVNGELVLRPRLQATSELLVAHLMYVSILFYLGSCWWMVDGKW